MRHATGELAEGLEPMLLKQRAFGFLTAFDLLLQRGDRGGLSKRTARGHPGQGEQRRGNQSREKAEFNETLMPARDDRPLVYRKADVSRKLAQLFVGEDAGHP